MDGDQIKYAGLRTVLRGEVSMCLANVVIPIRRAVLKPDIARQVSVTIDFREVHGGFFRDRCENELMVS